MSIVSQNTTATYRRGNRLPFSSKIRSEFLPFAVPDLDGSELLELQDTLESGWIATGPKTRQFEAEFAAGVGAKHAVAVNSCTAALHLSLEAVGLSPGDEVITTPYTFAATAEVIRYFQAHPVFVDVEPESLNINPELLANVITERTAAIIPVHLAGLPADLDRIHEVVGKSGIPVIEDAAHAFPAKLRGRQIGQVSDITCFSFYATKTMTTGEGGMVCTDDEALADRCRSLSNHGSDDAPWQPDAGNGKWECESSARGFKYNMTDISASIGLAQLRKSERMWQRRREIAMSYNAVFSSLAELECPSDRYDSQHAWHLYMLRIHLRRLRIDRGQFMDELQQRNIGGSVHFVPLHLHPYYRDRYGYKPDQFPVALCEYEREISLPIYSKMSDNDVQHVIDAVVDIVRRYRR